MEDLNLVSGKRDWKFWVRLVAFVVGAVLTLVGVIGNMVVMGRVFGYISLFSFVTTHWSFWVALVGIVVLVGDFVWYRFSKKGGK